MTIDQLFSKCLLASKVRTPDNHRSVHVFGDRIDNSSLKCRMSTTNYMNMPQCFNADSPYSVPTMFIIIESMGLV